MNFLVLDFESYYDKRSGYSLDKMTTESYVRDSRFRAHGASVKWGNGGPAVWLDEPQLRAFLPTVDWANTALVCYHAHFDGLILSHWYGVVPKLYICPLSMARLMIGNHISASLDSIRGYFGMRAKTTPYNIFHGKYWHELSPAEQVMVGRGANDEVESIWFIFQQLAKTFPVGEYEVVDATIRMFTQPVLVGNPAVLAEVWETESRDKEARYLALGLPDDSVLQSADQFAALLQACGVEPELKMGKKQLTWAFAKTDDFMQRLLEDEDDYIRGLAEARIGAKSTLLQTRAETLGYMAARGPLCVYLSYAAAHTTRWGGGDGTNFQNFPARKKAARRLREAIEAPEGYVIAKPDLSQIECRLLHTLAGDTEMVGKFSRGEDPYVDLASDIYGESIYKPKQGDPRFLEMETKRGTGKQGRLMCGYGAGWEKYKFTAKSGQYGPPMILSDEESQRHVKIYRDTNPHITAKNWGYWAQANRIIARLAGGPPMNWGPMRIDNGTIWLPNGCPLIYHLDYYTDFETGDAYWRRKTRRGYDKMYGAKLTEQTTQALARAVISDGAVRLIRQGYRIVNTEHDSLWILLKLDANLEAHKAHIREELRRRVDWLPELPLDVEIN